MKPERLRFSLPILLPKQNTMMVRCLLLWLLSITSTIGFQLSMANKDIAWTIAGSDSGGGAGIQADLRAFHALGVHGCSVITALTAQNSREVRHIQYASEDSLRSTLHALDEDLPAKCIKLGMLGTESVINEVSNYLSTYSGPIVCDPVMVSTSGSKLLDPAAESALVTKIFPQAALITPNKHEAEALLGTALVSPEDVEQGAAKLLELGPKSVLIKGGHLDEEGGFAQDYFTDGTTSMWLTVERTPNTNTHGTGCTLSSAIAACLSKGFTMGDAVTIAKAYVTQGIREAVQLGSGPGPVAQTCWPNTPESMPWITAKAETGVKRPLFPPCQPPDEWNVLPIVETAEWVERLVDLGVKDIQIRMKDVSEEHIDGEVGRAQAACAAGDARLWVNDHWKQAVKHQTYGVHLGQEDLVANLDGIAKIAEAGLRLGLSTHCYEELARALAVRPSYISLGPIYPTSSKKVRFGPQGLETLKEWRKLVNTPLIAIGGISFERAPEVIQAGSDSIAVISAITKSDSIAAAVKQWQELFKIKNSPEGSVTQTSMRS